MEKKGVSKVLKDNRYLIERMTSCIAAICDVGHEGLDPKIVFCADRLVSASIQFEHGQSKISPLRENCWVMQSSDSALESDELIKRVQNEIKVKCPSSSDALFVADIVAILKDECIKKYRATLEEKVLFRYGLSFEEFTKNQKSLDPDFIEKVSDELADFEYEFNGSFMVVGLDIVKSDSNTLVTPHIYIIESNGEHKLFDYLGFGAIGSGSNLAFSEFTKYAYSPVLTLPEAIVRVYAAKKVSERVEGVGKLTDLVILHVGDDKRGAFFETQPDFKEYLDTGLARKDDSEQKAYAELMKGCQKFFNPTPDSGK